MVTIHIAVGAVIIIISIFVTVKFLSTHIACNDTHKEATKVTDTGTVHVIEFVNGIQGITFGQHTNFTTNLVIHFFNGTEFRPDQSIKTNVDSRSEHLTHG